MEGPITARGIARRHHFFRKEERTPTVIGKNHYSTLHPTKGWRRTSYQRVQPTHGLWFDTIIGLLRRARRTA